MAVCDVQRQHAERAKEKHFAKADIYEDYRKLLDRKDIEAVTIGTPDHWHTEIALAALDGRQARLLRKAAHADDRRRQAAGRGGQEDRQGDAGRHAAARRSVRAVRPGRGHGAQRSVGQDQAKSPCNLPLSTEEGGPFAAQPVPEGLNWDFWLGQAPKVDYCPERCHFRFRWWYEYSGGIVHRLGRPSHGRRPVGAGRRELWPDDDRRHGHETARDSRRLQHAQAGDGQLSSIRATCTCTLQAQPPGDEGVMFEGEKGRIFVNRGRITGKPIEEQDADPKLKESIMADVEKLYKGNTAKMGDHMGNFFEAWKFGKWPISDVESQHRSVSACHLANISIRLKRKLTWDAAKEQFVGDSEADGMLKRPQREPYQLRAVS